MVAILADPVLFGEEFLSRHSDLVGVNFATHFVVSASRMSLAKIESELRTRNITYQRLPVSFAFHSQAIDKAKSGFESFMRSIRFKTGGLPMVCCEQADILAALPDDYFWRIARNPIRFREAVARLELRGTHRYIDVGPAGTLATFLKYGLDTSSRSTIHSLLSRFGTDRENLTALLASSRR